MSKYFKANKKLTGKEVILPGKGLVIEDEKEKARLLKHGAIIEITEEEAKELKIFVENETDENVSENIEENSEEDETEKEIIDYSIEELEAMPEEEFKALSEEQLDAIADKFNIDLSSRKQHTKADELFDELFDENKEQE